MRTYLAVIDDSPESALALRYAARRARATGGRLEALAVLPPADYVQWGGTQAALEEEERARIAGIVAAALADEPAATPDVRTVTGEPLEALSAYLGRRDDIAALVLGAAPAGSPGPLIEALTGEDAGRLPCPLFIVPGGLTPDRLDALS